MAQVAVRKLGARACRFKCDISKVALMPVRRNYEKLTCPRVLPPPGRACYSGDMVEGDRAAKQEENCLGELRLPKQTDFLH